MSLSTSSSAAKLWVAQDGMCFHCGRPMAFERATQMKHPPLAWSREHVVPYSKGGRAGTNIVLAHYKCNTERGNQDPSEEMLQKARRIWERAATLTPGDVRHIQFNPVFRFGLYPTEDDPRFIP
jgi:Uncharacterized protein conserved in bacteria